MWRHIASNFLTVFIVILVAVAGLIAWAQRQYVQPGPLTEAICLRVEGGARFSAVAEDLVAQGAITSGYIFKSGAGYEDKADLLKAGSFLVQPGQSMAEIVDQITRGGPSTCGTEIVYRIGVISADMVLRELDPATAKFTEVVKFDPAAEETPPEFTEVAERPDVRFRIVLAEGATSWQAVDALSRAGFLSGEVADVPAEGMLAPDSYDVERGSSRRELLDRMTAQQAQTLADLWAARADSLPYDTPEEALIMASIVEKETGVPEERNQVASVFVNRLQQGMKLQTDPTVIYGVTKGQGALGRGLRQSELRRETPYNTYVIDGLPPTPIANPGRASIEAALNPDTTDYLFFVADGTGGHAFAETLAEHNENVARWRKIEAERGQEGTTGVQSE